MKYYEQPENKEAARRLVMSQILDRWEKKDIETYWYNLGYEVLFVRELVNPFYINNETK